MNQTELLKLLESVRAGKLSPAAVIERLKHLPFEDLGFAKVDHHRTLRQGFSEVVFAKGKTPQQVAEIVRAMLQKKDSRHNILVTRADAKVFATVKKANGKTARAAKFHIAMTYPDGTPVVWVQEEPKNMGAWAYMNRELQGLVAGSFHWSCVSRPLSASPAT